jgi:hypothetical protein
MAANRSRARRDFAGVPDGEPLTALPSGLVLLRRKKHEPIDFKGLTEEERARRTGKIQGSKFGPEWTLSRYVEWLSSVVDEQGWTFPPGEHKRIMLTFSEMVGLVRGKPSTTVCVEVRERYVHAWPEET